MTPYQLKRKHQEAFSDSHFFSRDTMKFFGDTMRNFGVRSNGEDWELYRKTPVRHRLKFSHFFNKETFDLSTKE